MLIIVLRHVHIMQQFVFVHCSELLCSERCSEHSNIPPSYPPPSPRVVSAASPPRQILGVCPQSPPQYLSRILPPTQDLVSSLHLADVDVDDRNQMIWWKSCLCMFGWRFEKSFRAVEFLYNTNCVALVHL